MRPTLMGWVSGRLLSRLPENSEDTVILDIAQMSRSKNVPITLY